ncbi:hypothetical protein M2119_001285 [Aurantimicrobium minutum]|uniref:hypothetical protein n=1 Tax=Aurantimicrobium minutum TaxID=708131 RepID=UPI002474D2B8|nr:hypothetical protein [Aurantimicrobium minutum]MDH6533048.1 hypothetical protein [Aurantimicrobium minutum]
MDSDSTKRKFLGYVVTHYSSFADILHGEAELNGEQVSHQLSRCIRRENACDVGRDEGNELVWVHPEILEDNKPRATLHFSASDSMTPSIFDPPQEHVPRVSELHETVVSKQDGAHSVWELLRRIPRKILFAAGVGVIATVVGMTLISSPHPDQESVPVAIDPPRTEVTIPADEPEQAAIDFVLSGQVEGVGLGEGVAKDQLSAHVVSRSGEIVLVEVQRDAAGNLTTFATLLLQKSGAAWRIRQVFDPK